VRRAAWIVLAVIAAGALGAPALAPYPPSRQFPGFEYAPPMRPRIVDAEGRWHRPFVHPLRLVDRVERAYAVDTRTRIPIEWGVDGVLFGIRQGAGSPWFLLGADHLGRDVWSRLLHGARLSLGVALLGVFGALLLGGAAGGLAGYAGGRLDDAIMRIAEFVVVLPTIYVVLALRAMMPLVLPTATVFGLVALVLALVGWPVPARGVRAIVATEARKDYVAAAISLGASRTRVLVRHLLPAAVGFLLVQGAALLPAFLLAEATLSFVGLGFVEPTPSWGVMLQEAAQPATIAEFSWLLLPAAAILAVVLPVNVIAQPRPR
jgi:peptide/nickel transport system permease protein